MNKELLTALNEIKTSLSKIEKILSEKGGSADENIHFPNDKKYIFEKERNIAFEDEGDSIFELKSFFASKKIELNNYEKNLKDKTFSQLALFMGDKYALVSSLIKKLKTTLHTGSRIVFPIKSYPQESISAMCQLCNSFYENAFLKNYKYKKSPFYIIETSINRIPMFLNFLSGHWFELYNNIVIENILEGLISKYGINLNYKIYENVQIKLPNGDFFELDILVNINNNWYWAECKTSNYQDHVYKYEQFAKKYNFDLKKSFLVLLNEERQNLSNLNSLYDIQIYSIDEFKKSFKEIILKDFGIV